MECLLSNKREITKLYNNVLILILMECLLRLVDVDKNVEFSTSVS